MKIKNSKGFTLIELLIVVAIIAILAAIAIPQFAQYRVRGYNASANSDIRNCRTSEESVFADWQRYGRTEAVAVTAVVGGTAAGAQLLGPSNNNTSLGLTDPGGTARGISIAVGNNVGLQASIDAAYASYNIVAKHANGDTIYGADSDSTSLYRQQNTTWISLGLGGAGIPTIAAPPVQGTMDFVAPWASM